jgi:hypothetical protein
MPDDKEGKRRATRMNFSAVEWFELMERASNIDEVLTSYLVNPDAREEAPLVIDLPKTSTPKRPVNRSAVQGEEKEEEQEPLQKNMRKQLWLDVQSRSADERVHTPSTPSKVMQYQWKDVGFTGFSGIEHNEKGFEWFFTEDHAREDYAIHGDHDNGSPLLEFDTREVKVPNTKDLLTMIFVHMLVKEIGDLAKANCGGCADEQANQMGHMDPGCLDDWDQHIELYLHLARLRVSRMGMVNLSRKVMVVLKPHEEYVVGSVMPLINDMLDMPLQELKNKVETNHPLNRAYKAVFSDQDGEDDEDS